MRLLFLFVICVCLAPVALPFLGMWVAHANGCVLTEGYTSPCLIFGADWGGLLTYLFALGWLALATFPILVVAVALWIFVELIVFVSGWLF